jgi:hypothetical protein
VEGKRIGFSAGQPGGEMSVEYQIEVMWEENDWRRRGVFHSNKDAIENADRIMHASQKQTRVIEIVKDENVFWTSDSP